MVVPQLALEQTEDSRLEFEWDARNAETWRFTGKGEMTKSPVRQVRRSCQRHDAIPGAESPNVRLQL